MNIKSATYEKLSAQERVIASIEAIARGDEKEKNRLVQTCPKKTYTMSDCAYSDKMEALFDISMVIECDMRGYALNFLMVQWLDVALDEDKDGVLDKLVEKSPLSIREAISIRQAWHEVLEEEGIEPSVMVKSLGYDKHFVVELIESMADEMDLEPNPETVKMHKEALNEYLRKVMN